MDTSGDTSRGFLFELKEEFPPETFSTSATEAGRRCLHSHHATTGKALHLVELPFLIRLPVARTTAVIILPRYWRRKERLHVSPLAKSALVWATLKSN